MRRWGWPVLWVLVGATLVAAACSGDDGRDADATTTSTGVAAEPAVCTGTVEGEGRTTLAVLDVATGARCLEVRAGAPRRVGTLTVTGDVVVTGEQACGPPPVAWGTVARALDDGRELWRLPAAQGLRPGGPGAVAVDAGVVLREDGAGGLAAHDVHDGSVLWRQGGPVLPIGTSATSVVLADEEGDGIDFTTVVALDLASGVERWTHTLPAGRVAYAAVPAVAYGDVVVLATTEADRPPGGGSTTAVALDARTGELLWEQPLAPLGQGYVLGGGLVAGVGEATATVARDARTGEERWRSGHQLAPLPVADGNVYAGGGYALDARDGAERWRDPMPAVAAGAGVAVVVALDTPGALRGLDAATGAPRWDAGPFDAAWPGTPPAVVTRRGQLVVSALACPP